MIAFTARSFQSMAKKKKREIKKKKKREIKRKRKGESKKKSFDELPEPIIQHILSFLPEKDAIKTSILSKAWLSAWRTKPNLEFDFNLFFEVERKILTWDLDLDLDRESEKVGKKFSKYIKRTLKRYTEQKMSIEKLNLDWISTGDTFSYSLMERCTRVAVERGVKSLHLSASSCELPLSAPSCELPLIVLGAKSLENLCLVEFKMTHLSTEKIMWHSLKRLCLNMVCLDEVMFENIISSCPLLEILEIPYGTDDDLLFKVIEHHNLKRLNVQLFPGQRLILGEAPKLESLVCKNYWECYVEALGRYKWSPCGFSLHSSQSQYQNLKMLNMCSVDISDDFFNNLEHKFPHLQDLLVQHCQSLRRIQISSPSLERIHFMENYELEEAHFDVPSIELLEYQWINECDIIPKFSFSTATKGQWISKLRISWRGNVDSSWFLQLKKLLVSLIPSDIFLNIAIDDSIELDMNEIRNNSTFGEPQKLQELTLDINSSSILSALDGFFSICRPNSISQQRCENSYGLHKDDQLMKLLYDMLILRTNQDEHHKLQKQIKCWQHDLRQVQVQIYYYGGRRVGNTPVYVQKELVDEPLEALDWESILKVLRTPFRERIIHIALDWTKHSLSKKKKRCQKKQKN